MKPKYSNDHNFKVLFSNKTMLRELIEFINPILAEKLDWKQMETPYTEVSYLSEQLKKFSEDLIVKVPLKNKQENIYLIILIEFQSTIDKFMPLRVLNYLTLFWQDWLKRQPDKPDFLPPVFPVVFYNGKPKWTSSSSIRDLIYPFPDSEQFNPDFQFYPFYLNQLDINRINQLNNALGTVLKLEKSIIFPETIKEILRDSVNVDNSNGEVIKLINLWFHKLIEGERISINDLEMINDIDFNIEEKQTMLTEALNNYYEETIQKGITQGIEQGKQLGLSEGGQKAKLETARNLLKKGVDINIVLEATGLKREDLSADKTD